MSKKQVFWQVLMASSVAVWMAASAHADVFNLPHYVPGGTFSVGLEPELTLSSGAGMGVNARFTQGITDLISVSAQIGTGGGPRRFRVGGDVDFDFIPDLPGQPGIGMALRGMFVRVPTPSPIVAGDVSGQVELTALPYIHKGFESGDSVIDPFFSVPVGMAFLDGQYTGLVTAVVGAMIKGNEHFWFNAEFGIAINHTETYFAAGVTYYP